MKIIYIANARIPTEKAHGLQIAKMCEAFAQSKNVDLTLLIPKRKKDLKQDLFSYYDVEKIFKVKRIGYLNPKFYLLSTFIYLCSVQLYLIREFLKNIKRRKKIVIYTRGELVIFLANFSLFFPIIWESHIKPSKMWLYKNVFKRVAGIVTVTSCYYNELAQRHGVNGERMLYWPDGVNLKSFKREFSKDEARVILKLPKNKKIIVYVGSDLIWKGLSVLKKVSHSLSDDYLILFIGNISGNGINERSRTIGYKKNKEVAIYMKAADALILTGDINFKEARYYTSPLKLFEYMASDRPIIASDLPSFRDVLNNNNSVLVESNNAESLIQAIRRIINNEDFGKRIATTAHRNVEKYSWDNRAKNILNFINERLYA